MLQLITKAFGHWDLMTSFSGNWENRSDAVKNVLNLSLTDVYLPLISATGHSPLFSLEVDAETNIIRISSGQLSSDPYFLNEIGFRDLKQMFYRTFEFLNLNRSNNQSLNEAFELFDRLAGSSLGSRKYPKSSKIVTLRELNVICEQIDWDYLFTKLFDQNGLTTYNPRQIEIADTFLLQYRCGLHKIQLETDAGKSALYNLAILNFVVQHAVSSGNLDTDNYMTNPGKPTSIT
ncbi:unnamed protein product [Schistosoma turkestanicum]|nr:unnamed protein product [Schistosoma turkestanicum]